MSADLRPARSVTDALVARGVAADVIAAVTVVSSLQRVATRVHYHLEQGVLLDVGLSRSGFLALHVLCLNGEQQTRHLAEAVGVNRSTLSGVLATLEGRGLITRRRHATDGRLVVAALTDAGGALVDAVASAFAAEQVAVVENSRLGAHRLRALVDALRSIEQRLAPAREVDRG